MNSRIDTTFQKLREKNGKAFVAYVCGGDPDYEKSLAVIRALADEGTDIIELGSPFSDPQADGIVNQLASERALASGMSLKKTLDLVREFRTTHQTAVVIYAYMNPIYSYGYEKFHEDAFEAGADGVLLLDLPPDEIPLNKEFKSSGKLQHITLISPTTPPDRIKFLAEQAEGFIYALSRLGVTGAQATPSEEVGSIVRKIKQHTDLPVCIGFGINTPEQAAQIAGVCDGVVVGSGIVKQIAENASEKNIAESVIRFTSPLIQATKNLS